MSFYSRAGNDIVKLVQNAAKLYHPALIEAEVTFDVLMAYSPRNDDGQVKGPALKFGGYPANAIVRIVPLKDRVKGAADVEITLDGDQWPDWNAQEKIALIDHELTHLNVIREGRDGSGPVKTDDHGRPRLKLRKHDIQVGWFLEVAERHRDVSFECAQYAQIYHKHHQTLFAWVEA